MKYKPVEFGKRLIITGDLDPVYNMLHGSGLSWEYKARWCLAYWYYYHVGIAAAIADYDDPNEYYGAMLEIAKQTGGKRGAERRHFRGSKAVRTVNALSHIGTPEEIVRWIFKTQKYEECSKRVRSLPMCGTWIAWKICDMGERCLGYPVDFSSASLAMYRDPKQGAALLKYRDWKAPITPEEVKAVSDEIIRELCLFKAPPDDCRNINIQESETVLCKFKSYWKGHYYVGKDIHDIHEAIDTYSGVNYEALKQAIPDEPECE